PPANCVLSFLSVAASTATGLPEVPTALVSALLVKSEVKQPPKTSTRLLNFFPSEASSSSKNVFAFMPFASLLGSLLCVAIPASARVRHGAKRSAKKRAPNERGRHRR